MGLPFKVKSQKIQFKTQIFYLRETKSSEPPLNLSMKKTENRPQKRTQGSQMSTLFRHRMWHCKACEDAGAKATSRHWIFPDCGHEIRISLEDVCKKAPTRQFYLGPGLVCCPHKDIFFESLINHDYLHAWGHLTQMDEYDPTTTYTSILPHTSWAVFWASTLEEQQKQSEWCTIHLFLVQDVCQKKECL